MNNKSFEIELHKLITRIGIREYDHKVIFSNADSIIREIVERLIIEPNTRELVNMYKKVRDSNKRG